MTHILISPAWRHLSDWIHRVPELFETSGTVVYDSRNLIKKFTLPDGTCLNVKRYHAPAASTNWSIRSDCARPRGCAPTNIPNGCCVPASPHPRRWPISSSVTAVG